ncbi:MAG: HlyC/CorC family transporter [Calditrichaeota bacterium]|nr:HlyC/CorC family transporter [Calditrichota bacterium]MCB0289347.1 HlyC/CorC family transporter [Calditrichota bacterium]MCB0293717.1 HlyC/CorC family transporter [Calditrichota bacterium]MCB9090241.1 HlyC/CorC family transporter [Calditrichia bacterium]
MGYDILYYAVIFLVLLGLSAFFSGSETAFFSLSKSTLEQFRISLKKSEQRVALLMASPRQLLITIVVGNTIVNITTASLAAILTTRITLAMGFNHQIAILIDVIVVTLVILITSEILPKVIAVRNPKSFSGIAATPLLICFRLFQPLTAVLTRFTRFLQHSMGFSEERMLLSEEELKTLVEVGEEHGTLEKEEKEMIHSIFEFGETAVREIMIPRTDMVSVEVNTTLERLMAVVKDKLLSRIPVYEERIDNVIGILYVKDLLPLLSKKRHDKFDLKKLVRPPRFVPEQKMIDDLLREFQKERIHMALVVDEYGGISGLVTLEDVIEEIVGEIQDEYDKELPLYRIIDEYTFIVDGRMSLEEINDELNLNLPMEEGVETISGFILALLGALPQEKQRVRFNSYTFVMERVVRNRILQVRIEKEKPETTHVESEVAQP